MNTGEIEVCFVRRNRLCELAFGWNRLGAKQQVGGRETATVSASEQRVLRVSGSVYGRLTNCNEK
jgi:hypothetical protein